MRGMILGLAVLMMTAPAALAQEDWSGGDPEKGERVFAVCKACHQVGENAKNRVGPVLNGLFGREAGTIEGYNYSKANKESGITWTPEVFAEYIKNPRAMMPGTKMAFAGIKQEDRIRDLIAFLQQFEEDGTKKAQ